MGLPVAGVDVVTLFVEDLVVARRFYEEALGLDVAFADADSCAVQLGSTLINLLAADQAGELVEPATVGEAGAGCRVLLTARVADVDAVCARLTGDGVRLLNGPVDRPWGMRTAAFADPAGHVWELAQPLPAA